MATFDVINPATDQKVGTYEIISEDRALAAAERARDSFGARWSNIAIGERAQYLRNLAKALRAKHSEYARMMTVEMGKPISQSESEVEKCAWTAEVVAENAETWLSDEVVKTDSKLSYVKLQPLGVVLSVMPWNFPFWQAFRFAIPALAAGNTSVLRHSNVCPGCSMAIEDAFVSARFPEDVFRSVITGHGAVSKLIESPFIQGVSITGSVEAGIIVAEQAARSLKKCVLELGGSDPFIVLGDADVEKAAKVGANARLINSGQSCIAAKRFIVVRSVAGTFTERFIQEFEKKKTGDPMDSSTDVGPLANKEQVVTLDTQVKAALSKGARAGIGGHPRDGIGAFYEPTVLENVRPEMEVMHEEVFGPVAPIYVVNNEDEAIRTANDSEFGLGASVWTSDPSKIHQLASRIESGMVFINALVKSDPRMPFGGIKKSGIGRELFKYGLKEFVNVKSVNVYDIDLKHETA